MMVQMKLRGNKSCDMDIEELANRFLGKKVASPKRADLASVNSHLVCILCGGYFVEATTIVECLHTFCRSCIVKYIQRNHFCPICEVQLHQTKPWGSLRPDKLLQDIVYKLVPGLYQNEMTRRREFYARMRGKPDVEDGEERGSLPQGARFYSQDDSISLSLEYYSGFEEEEEDDQNLESYRKILKDKPRRYLQCPAAVTVRHLKKFLRMKYGIGVESWVDILYNDESLPEDFSLIDVAYTYSWKRTSPMRFSYRIFSKVTIKTVGPEMDIQVSKVEEENKKTKQQPSLEQQQKQSEYLGNLNLNPTNAKLCKNQTQNKSKSSGDTLNHKNTNQETTVKLSHKNTRQIQSSNKLSQNRGILKNGNSQKSKNNKSGWRNNKNRSSSSNNNNTSVKNNNTANDKKSKREENHVKSVTIFEDDKIYHPNEDSSLSSDQAVQENSKSSSEDSGESVDGPKSLQKSNSNLNGLGEETVDSFTAKKFLRNKFRNVEKKEKKRFEGAIRGQKRKRSSSCVESYAEVRKRNSFKRRKSVAADEYSSKRGNDAEISQSFPERTDDEESNENLKSEALRKVFVTKDKPDTSSKKEKDVDGWKKKRKKSKHHDGENKRRKLEEEPTSPSILTFTSDPLKLKVKLNQNKPVIQSPKEEPEKLKKKEIEKKEQVNEVSSRSSEKENSERKDGREKGEKNEAREQGERRESREKLDKKETREKAERRESREKVGKKESQEKTEKKDEKEKVDKRETREKLDKKDEKEEKEVVDKDKKEPREKPEKKDEKVDKRESREKSGKKEEKEKADKKDPREKGDKKQNRDNAGKKDEKEKKESREKSEKKENKEKVDKKETREKPEKKEEKEKVDKKETREKVDKRESRESVDKEEADKKENMDNGGKNDVGEKAAEKETREKIDINEEMAKAGQKEDKEKGDKKETQEKVDTNEDREKEKQEAEEKGTKEPTTTATADTTTTIEITIAPAETTTTTATSPTSTTISTTSTDITTTTPTTTNASSPPPQPSSSSSPPPPQPSQSQPSSSDKERLLHLRQVRHKNSNKTTVTEIISAPPSLTISKVDSTEPPPVKMPVDESKPSLEIVLVNPTENKKTKKAEKKQEPQIKFVEPPDGDTPADIFEGVLDLSEKSSRTKDNPPPNSNSESNSPSPNPSTSPETSEKSRKILEIAQTLVSRKMAPMLKDNQFKNPFEGPGDSSAAAAAAMRNLKTLSDTAVNILMAAQNNFSTKSETSNRPPASSPPPSTNKTLPTTTTSTKAGKDCDSGSGLKIPTFPMNRDRPIPPVPNLQEIFPRGRGRPKPLMSTPVAKPGQNQTVRQIPNPFAVLNRHSNQNSLRTMFPKPDEEPPTPSQSSKQKQIPPLQSIRPSYPPPLMSEANRITYESLVPKMWGFNGNGNNNHNGGRGFQNPSDGNFRGMRNGDDPSNRYHPMRYVAPNTSMRRMEHMTKNIESVAAGLTARAASNAMVDAK